MLTNRKYLFNISPTIGIALFIFIYIYASTIYPGGSQANPNSIGFDWVHNYWCNLTDKIALNGQENPARTFAAPAVIVLCFSLLVFFFLFSNSLARNTNWKRAIQICGTVSMITTPLIMTDYHNQVVGFASSFGLIALIGLISGLSKHKLHNYNLMGMVCIFLLVINNVFYYTRIWVDLLPLLQKLAFAAVLVWFSLINLRIARDNLVPR